MSFSKEKNKKAGLLLFNSLFFVILQNDINGYI